MARREVPPDGERRRSGLTAARAYHPRGHTLRDQPAADDPPARGGDPFRPALKLLEESSAPRSAGGNGRGSRGAPSPASEPVRSGKPVRNGRPAPTGKQGGGKQGGGKQGGGKQGGGKPGQGGGRSDGSGEPVRDGKPGRPAARGAQPKRDSARSRQRPPSRRPPKLAEPRRRLRLATLLALTLFAALGVRLIELQLNDGPAYAASGLANRLETVVLPAPRGAIYDREGAVLAHSTEARFVFADPELVVDPAHNAAMLQPLLGIPASELVELMQPQVRDNGEKSRFAWLARGVDIETADEIVALNLPGIGIDRDERRHVPGNDLAANLIGFTGTDLNGLAGLEAQLDDVLRGVNGSRTFETGQGARLDRAIPGGYRVETPAEPGSHVRLTIDADLQYEVQRILAERVRPVGATFGTAVVLDARTFEVLAQASYPGYNAADPDSASEQERTDVATSRVFDPGSAHKPIVIGAALEEGVVGAGDTVTVDPTIRKGDTTFGDTAWHPPGTDMTLPAIMGFSSNVGTIKIADMLGKDTLYAYQQAFGLGSATGIGLPGEATGGLLAPDDWSGSSYGSVPIGHSVDITALQLAAAYGVIANDGTWVRPSLVGSVVAADGTERPAEDPEQRQVLSPHTAADLREIMEAVVTVPGATGLDAAVDGYRVAGKTGTGKLVVDGQYAEGNVASFVGMAPAEAPRFVVAVVAHTPDGGSGEVTGPAFREMMSFALKHYRVPPSDSAAPTFELYR